MDKGRIIRLTEMLCAEVRLYEMQPPFPASRPLRNIYEMYQSLIYQELDEQLAAEFEDYFPRFAFDAIGLEVELFDDDARTRNKIAEHETAMTLIAQMKGWLAGLADTW